VIFHTREATQCPLRTLCQTSVIFHTREATQCPSRTLCNRLGWLFVLADAR